MRSRPFTVDRRAVAGTREWPGPHPAVIIARLILLVLVGTLSVYATQQPSRVIWAVLLAIAAAVTDALQRTIQDRRDRPQPYAEATRLLTQLRSVARQLPGATLDPGGLGEHLIEEVRTVARVDRGAVLSAGGGSRLVVIAQMGVDHIDWETALDSDSAISEAWTTQQPQAVNRSQARSHPGGEVCA